MRIEIFSLQNSHSLATAARFSTKKTKKITTRVIESIDDLSPETTDDIGLLCVGTNLHQIISEIKLAKINIPVIAMPAKNDTEADIALLDDGYDDVVRSDCDVNELAARFRAIMRKSISCYSNEIKNGRLVTFLDGKDPEVDGNRVKLTNIEHTILDAIVRRSGNIISRESLFERVWPNNEKQPYDKVLDVHIFNLRKKLKQASGGNAFIETLPQRGYRLSLDH